MRFSLPRLVFPVIFLTLVATAAFALPPPQADAPPSVVSGVVLDTTGGAIRHATVHLRLRETSDRTAVTDARGAFVFESVPPGPVTIIVAADMFAPATLDIDRNQGPATVIMQPVAIAELVTVRASYLKENRITAAKTDLPTRDLPQAVTVVTSDVIADQSMQSMADVVRYVPGIGMAQGEGHRDAPIFRGNNSTADFFVNGVRDDVQYFRDLYNVDRIEALKGPNAMLFGRGGIGGVINRVTRQADWTSNRSATLETGSWGHRRFTADLGQAIGPRWAFRVGSMYENSDSYRQGVGLERYGVNPTIAVALSAKTTFRAGYERFHDARTVDRGVPSFAGRPVATDVSTFFGDRNSSRANASVSWLTSALEHRVSDRLAFRNHISFADYDKFYQNVYPGSAVNGAGTSLNLAAYNNATRRRNLFNQSDLTLSARTGRIGHQVLGGIELGRQLTDNFRNTGYFTSVGATVTSIAVPLSNPVTSLPVAFRQSATDADNHGVATQAALYVQDQVGFSRHVQAVLGVRYDRFDVDFRNNRTSATFGSEDNLISPRLGLIYKPMEPLSVYTSYGTSYLPRAGEQLSSLSLSNRSLDPEHFRNYEVGAKWDIRPTLAFSTALYRLDRGNVAVPDPNDANKSLLVDGQRTSGVEIGLSGNVTRAWTLMGGYAYQDGEITRTQSAAAQAGASLSQVPRHSFSLWNKYDVTEKLSAGLGVIHRGDVFASTDNTVVLPAFTRVDAALFFAVSARLRAQLNLENLFDERYYASANGNNNITPGSPRAIRVGLTTRF